MKYRETKVVNYRQEDDDSNTLSTCTFLDCDEYRTDCDGQIDTTRQKCALGIQYKHKSKEDIAGFISKPIARPEYGMIYQHRLFRQTHKTFQIHHLGLLMFKDYNMVLVGTLQRIHRQYVRYESALGDTLIGIEHLNSGYLMHCILDPKILAKYLEAIKDDLEETAPEFEPVFTNIYQYYGNSLISFTNTIDDLLLQLPILIKLKVQVPMSLFSIETAPVPLDAEHI